MIATVKGRGWVESVKIVSRKVEGPAAAATAAETEVNVHISKAERQGGGRCPFYAPGTIFPALSLSFFAPVFQKSNEKAGAGSAPAPDAADRR